MIPFDFEYYRPSTFEEAVRTFHTLDNSGKNVIFLSGGTEFITMARMSHVSADAVIDLKGIAECQKLEIRGEKVVIGSAVTLNKIADTNIYPLLGQKLKGIADHTSRNKITLGGNLQSKLIYREAVLPLLLAEATIKVAGSNGIEFFPIAEVFNQTLNLKHGQFLMQVLVDREYTELPYISLKKTKMSKVGYPIVSLAAFAKDKKICAAFSGVCEYPFRSEQIEEILNDFSIPLKDRIMEAIKLLPSPIVNDIWASAEYREFVFQNTIQEMLYELEGKIS
ncbi:xanthine dehydrogenase [Cytobacillus depressus]|uniref:Xanthine dehydrogenase n=1 Tax=Cytobacillus depressus TaxID=1602942 RepID=A0A6L3V4S8_9BACI|nr:FAD binding domain-containing protein [Cytobacillus depressus]KAB2333243.1 xanthine dehydrogenase [Cytobacillus depressus]